jgi:hypothetical protein
MTAIWTDERDALFSASRSIGGARAAANDKDGG